MKKKLLISLGASICLFSSVGYAETVTLANELRGKTVNINNANIEAIVNHTSLDKGVAIEIVNYRKKYGHFKRISELLRVPGVQYKDIRDNKNISLK